MRKFKAIIFSSLCVVLISLLGVEVLAAVYLNVKVKGDIVYTAADIGAEIYCMHKLNSTTSTDAQYALVTGNGETRDNVYYEGGAAHDYSGIVADVGTVQFKNKSDNLEIYLFVKNAGDRFIVPNVAINTSSSDIVLSTETFFFDTSQGQIDPMAVKSSAANAQSCFNTVKEQITNGNCGVFSANSSIDNDDVFVLKAIVEISDSAAGSSATDVLATFAISISFSADSVYESNDILSVYREQNSTNTKWTKFGYNATLNAAATTVEENNMVNLEKRLWQENRDENGNADITYGVDDYSVLAPVYKDIDLVNIDINTGEIIGRLSDINYNFEWFGRTITLKSGTTLASGRTLSADESFTVDVYTYYPTMYIRRWLIGNNQWISLSDKTFQGAIKIDEHYIATFESTLFNADKTVAYNEYGVIPRSYVFDHSPITVGSAEYLLSYYNYTNPNGKDVTANFSQQQMLDWCSNLTKKWKAFNSANPALKTAKACSGEDYTAYVYALLYLVKYANSNSQEAVGFGNVMTFSAYHVAAATITTDNGTVINTSVSDAYKRYETQKGGSTIGLYNGAVQNAAKMAYGYQSTYVNGTDKQGIYMHQFLTYNNGTKRILCDGYVGSNQYTSVFCLGRSNPWGNVWTWIFGSAAISDGSNIYMYVKLEHYDYLNKNYITSTSSGFASNKQILENAGYVCLSYKLASADGFYNHTGVSTMQSASGIETLIGMQSSDAGAGGGLTDHHDVTLATTCITGVSQGAASSSGGNAGLFAFDIGRNIDNSDFAGRGLRTMLIP